MDLWPRLHADQLWTGDRCLNKTVLTLLESKGWGAAGGGVACAPSRLGVSPDSTFANMQKPGVGARQGDRALFSVTGSFFFMNSPGALSDVRWWPVTLSYHLLLTSLPLKTKQTSQLPSWELCLEDKLTAKAKMQREVGGGWMPSPASKQAGSSTACRGGVRPAGRPFPVPVIPVPGSW